MSQVVLMQRDETTCLRPALHPTQHSLLYRWYQRLPLVVKQVGMKLTTRPDLVLIASVPVLDNLSVVLKVSKCVDM
jgi:hypothetical protein